MPHPLSGATKAWWLYWVDREFRTAVDVSLNAQFVSADDRSQHPKRALSGATLMHGSDLERFVRRYKKLLTKRKSRMSDDQCIAKIFERPLFKSFIGNTRHFYGLQPVYDRARRRIILTAAIDNM